MPTRDQRKKFAHISAFVRIYRYVFSEYRMIMCVYRYAYEDICKCVRYNGIWKFHQEYEWYVCVKLSFYLKIRWSVDIPSEIPAICGAATAAHEANAFEIRKLWEDMSTSSQTHVLRTINNVILRIGVRIVNLERITSNSGKTKNQKYTDMSMNCELMRSHSIMCVILYLSKSIFWFVSHFFELLRCTASTANSVTKAWKDFSYFIGIDWAKWRRLTEPNEFLYNYSVLLYYRHRQRWVWKNLFDWLRQDNHFECRLRQITLERVAAVVGVIRRKFSHRWIWKVVSGCASVCVIDKKVNRGLPSRQHILTVSQSFAHIKHHR